MLERPERILERFPLVQDPPFKLEGSRTFIFVLPCDGAKLDQLLSRTFGWAAPDIDVRRLGSSCMLVLTDVAKASAADPSLGWFTYHEATFFVPVWGFNGGAPFVAMHVPFIYPDEGLAIASGREVYGLPKKPATLSIPGDDDFWDGVAPITVSALAARQFDGSQWTQEPLITIDAQPQSPAASLADDVLDALDAAFGPTPGPLGAIGHLLEQDLLQLKQVADVRTHGVPPRVLYRAVTHAPAPVDNLSNVRIGDASKVTVNLAEIASEPIRDVLGLPAAVTPTVAASLTMDFSLEAGDVWKEQPDSGTVPAHKDKVLILGGGMGALATAYYLSDTEERRDKYDVRVLAMGGILGGKGANWRNPTRAHRIEEHGIHVIFGFYHNFLRMFRDVYAEAHRPQNVDPSTFDEAFSPRWDVVFNDGTDSYTVHFPRTPSGWGAGPQTVEQQLMMAATMVQSVFGGSFGSMITGALLPGIGNKVASQIFAFVLTLLKAIFEDHIVRGKSWDELDQHDFRQWMDSHKIPGLPAIEHSAIMQVPYDGVFAYEGADTSNPQLSAGVAARGLLKLVADYEKAVLFDMDVGMGEAVFAPLLEVLEDRGVKIEFFSKVKGVHLVGGQVEKVTYGKQAIVTAGPYAYDPLTNFGTVRIWRRHPDLSQLTPPVPIAGKDPYADDVTAQVGPDIELDVGADFDWVVCALPAPVTAKVLSGHLANPVLSRIQNIPTVATLHLETWMNDDLPMLGWPWGSVVLGGFRQPLNSFQENGRLLLVEGWTGPGGPRSLLYCSGPFGGGWTTDSFDPASRAAAEVAAKDSATTFLLNEYWRLLPAAKVAGPPPQFDVAALHAPWNPGDPIADQYIRHNIDEWARYVLMKPGTLADRPEPVPPGLSNLRLAGDWTKNGIDIPSMEGTVISGMKVAASITGEDLDILW